ncbi:hypothetical protein D0Z03_001649 [Geotrichum reessii]|nr:hypothetical protein D0Z03_001649 [Galactomyces reessii]
MYKSLPIPFDSDVVATRITIVDLPGHAKLGHILNETLNNYSNIKGILFVIDAAAGNNGVRIAAERLFTLLLRTEQRMGGIDLMIACNKADVFNMIPAVRMKKLLEEEIQNIRETKAKGLGTVGASGSLDDDNEDDGTLLASTTKSVEVSKKHEKSTIKSKETVGTSDEEEVENEEEEDDDDDDDIANDLEQEIAKHEAMAEVKGAGKDSDEDSSSEEE